MPTPSPAPSAVVLMELCVDPVDSGVPGVEADAEAEAEALTAATEVEVGADTATELAVVRIVGAELAVVEMCVCVYDSPMMVTV